MRCRRARAHPARPQSPVASAPKWRLLPATLTPAGQQDALREALAALAAESLGISARLLKTTREYLMTREQFGAKLASFQVLQHRMVDLFIAVEDLRTLARIAAIAAQLPDLRTLEATRVKLIQTLPAVGRQAVQLHGGMGMSDEYHVGDCMKRLEAIALSCGRIEQALDRFAATASPGISVHP